MKVKRTKLVFNAVQCGKCNDVVASTHRHDFRYCKCGAIAVDGGLEYAKRVGDIHGYQDLSEYEDYISDETDFERNCREDGYPIVKAENYV